MHVKVILNNLFNFIYLLWLCFQPKFQFHRDADDNWRIWRETSNTTDVQQRLYVVLGWEREMEKSWLCV